MQEWGALIREPCLGDLERPPLRRQKLKRTPQIHKVEQVADNFSNKTFTFEYMFSLDNPPARTLHLH